MLGCSIVFGAVSWYRHLSYKVSFAIGIGALLVAGVTLAAGREDIGNAIALLAYYLMVTGVLLAILEYRREVTVSGAVE